MNSASPSASFASANGTSLAPILAPLGMARTAFRYTEGMVATAATGYTRLTPGGGVVILDAAGMRPDFPSVDREPLLFDPSFIHN